MKIRHWMTASTVALFCPAAFGVSALGQEAERKSVVVQHPNLLLSPTEIEGLKRKVQENAWAGHLLDRVKAKAEKDGAPLESALAYTLTGEARYALSARKQLLHDAREQMPHYEKIDVKAEPEWGRWSWWGAIAWAYDLTFDTFTLEERAEVEQWLRTAGRTIIAQEDVLTTTPNLVFCEHWRVGMIGYCLGDTELIEWALRDSGKHGASRGGFYPVMDTMIRDEQFWAEAPIYALHYDVHGMFSLAEAALRYDGTDLFHYVSPKSGASLKKIVDGYLRMAFPLEESGPQSSGRVRLATFGDGSTGCFVNGRLEDTFLDESFMAVLELAYQRFHDEGYAWLLSLDPDRQAYIGRGRPAFSYVALTHGEPLPANPAPPPAPSGLYSSMGFAMLRSDESPRYWTTGGLAAVVRLGTSVGHGHDDYFSLILHANGHLLYPDINVIQYEPRWLNWTAEGIGHSTLLIDHESPAPGKQATRHDFTPEVKFFAVEGSAFEKSVQERALLMTNNYLVDIFRAADTEGRERTFDWVVHGLGRLYPGNPAAYRPSLDLVPYYGWIDRERSRTCDGAWQADWVQSRAGILEREGTPSENETGVRVTVLGVPGTRIYAGDGPLADAPPHHRLDGHPEPSCPLILVRRQAKAATYAAVHEPYSNRPSIRSISLLQETGEAIGMKVDSDGSSDRVLVRFGSSPDTTVLRSPDGEAFRFAGYCFVRRAGQTVVARGKLEGFRIRADRGDLSLVVNGRKESPVVQDGFLVFGDMPAKAEAGDSPSLPTAAETKAAIHSYFLPEEVRLKAGAEREVALTLRAVGQGEAAGVLRFVAPEGISVEPETVELSPPLTEGAARTVTLRVRARAELPSGLFQMRAEPVGDTPAAVETLPISVGVVLRKDRRVPRLAQWVARAPGYTMKVDEFSGVATYLLDSDGHRRFGRFATGNFIYGFGAIQRGDNWIFRAQQACQQVWSSPHSLTFLSDGRLQYTFHDDQIAIKYLNPSHADQEQPMWLGNFDMLEAPIHNGTQRVPHEPVVAEWLFFPHPIFRQGVLLRFTKKTPVTLHLSNPTVAQSAVHFPMRSGEEVLLGFATREELPQGK
jgi:hypothetical protein